MHTLDSRSPKQRQRRQLSVYDGQDHVGNIEQICNRWLASDAAGRIIGSYHSMKAAMTAISKWGRTA
jgi:hypothetical protein